MHGTRVPTPTPASALTLAQTHAYMHMQGACLKAASGTEILVMCMEPRKRGAPRVCNHIHIHISEAPWFSNLATDTQAAVKGGRERYYTFLKVPGKSLRQFLTARR